MLVVVAVSCIFFASCNNRGDGAATLTLAVNSGVEGDALKIEV